MKGYTSMSCKVKKVLSGLLLVGTLATSSIPALAATANVEGGIWSYGTKVSGINQKTVYSNYLHNSRRHRSSVTIDTTYVNSGWVSPGVTSYASAVGAWNAGTHAYYQVD